VKTTWRDGARVREVELRAIAPGRWRVRVDDADDLMTGIMTIFKVTACISREFQSTRNPGSSEPAASFHSSASSNGTLVARAIACVIERPPNSSRREK